MQVNCLIIDDEFLARRRLLDLISKRTEFEVLSESKTGQQAILDIDKFKPDVIFLDIEMKDMTGFDVLKNINHQPITIFVTAYKDYAVEAFEFFAFDYLLKPFNKERFNLTVDRVLSYYENKQALSKVLRIEDLLLHLERLNKLASNEVYNQRITIKNGNEAIFVDYKDVLYIQASGNYIELFTLDKNHLIRTTMSRFLNNNSLDYFAQIHRSTIVNLNFVEKLICSDHGEIDLKMTNDKLLRVSKSFKKSVQKLLGI